MKRNVKKFQLIEVKPDQYIIKTVFKDGTETQVTGGPEYGEPILYSPDKALKGVKKMREILGDPETPIVVV